MVIWRWKAWAGERGLGLGVNKPRAHAAREPTPLPIPEDAASVMFVGGTFDPPHRAHVELPMRVRDAAEPGAWLVYVPAAQSPHKDAGPVASDADRVAMLELALADVPRSAVWTDELDRDSPSYWVETIRRARRLRPDARLRFVIGTDQAVAFHRWHLAGEILELAEPMVLLREPIGSAEALVEALASARVDDQRAWSGEAIERWRSWIAPVEPMPAASTDVRGGDGSALATAVRSYIVEHGLYAGLV